MPINDAGARTPSTRTYRAAVWLARLDLVLLLACCWMLFVQPPDLVFILTWLVGLLMAVTLLVLLRRSGVLSLRGSTSQLVESQARQRQFYCDVFWRQRR